MGCFASEASSPGQVDFLQAQRLAPGRWDKFVIPVGRKSKFCGPGYTSTPRSLRSVLIFAEEEVASFVVLSHGVAHKLGSVERFYVEHVSSKYSMGRQNRFNDIILL